ncbi:FecR family protein [Methylobacterium sp. NEAU 140]|uniref:FecR family protein n=1 Tax=Methylobacterium sp. NEAU 140 TaxID=3064945 RepID=UPI0027373AAE|nr:FecR family protein [Methylobacterium sp. NEAU 140]MDP4022103.1 FecR family protein [Methylobacterium sp. NEAU 140]
MTPLRHACAIVAACAALATPGAVQAQQRIGATTVVQNDVSRVSGAQRDRLATGEAVFRNEAVQTGADSLAKIVFVDQTNLSIGPNARVSLNQYVYSEDRPAGKVALNLLKGTYRFVTGDLEKKAYQINTPVATIGVRGTTFDVSTTGSRSVITLLSGAVQVCTRSATPQVCLTLDQSGQVAIVTATGATIAPNNGSETRFAFSGYCGANPGLCTPTRLAENGTVPQPTAFAALCGR